MSNNAAPLSSAPKSSNDYNFGVLVVDDDLVILSLLKDIISMIPGCTVKTANQPSEAMKEIVRGGIDIVLTDVHMPGVTGLEMLKDIIDLQQTPEIIVMTAYPSGEIAQQAMELGATSLLAKPFEDIALVEAELEKAIKKILRQRSARAEVTAKKAELSRTQKSAPDNDAVMHVEMPSLSPSLLSPSLGMEAPPAALVQPTSGVTPAKKPPSGKMADAFLPPTDGGTGPIKGFAVPGATLLGDALEYGKLPDRKVYSQDLLEPLIEIEMERCKRYKRQLAIGFIDLPETAHLAKHQDPEAVRANQIAELEYCVRRSDVVLDLGRDGVAVVAYECNRVGVEVVEHKLMSHGFQHSGFAVYPTEGKTCDALVLSARKALQSKRKFQLLILEQEEFFARILLNMLSDPKYHTTWTASYDEAYGHINRMSEKFKLMALSLTKDPRQWQLLARLKKENLIHWPIVLFIDVPLTPELRDQLKSFGVRAVINRSVSQEEFTYIVQTFVLPKPIQMERKNFRALVTLPVQYDLEGKRISSNTFTLSRDGVFIRDMNPPQSGTILPLEMFLPGRRESMKTKVEVLYTVPYFVGVNRFHVAGIAVRFLDLNEAQKAEIDHFVDHCRASYFL